MPLSILRRLYAAVDVKPGVVQNRFIAETRYEIPLRRFCRVRGISFQAFSVLKDESDVLNSTLVENAAACLGKGTSKGLAMHLMALSLGNYMLIVNGIEIDEQMEENVRGLARFTDPNDIEVWKEFMTQFRDMIGEAWSFKP